MNTLDFLYKHFSTPFCVSDGNRYYRIIDKSDFCYVATVLQKLSIRKFINVLGGCAIDNVEAKKPKWRYFKPVGFLTKEEKFILDLEITVHPYERLLNFDNFEQLKMNI